MVLKGRIYENYPNEGDKTIFYIQGDNEQFPLRKGIVRSHTFVYI